MLNSWMWYAQELNIIYQQIIDNLWLYLPFGVIGIWRWGMWVLRKITGLFYRPTPMVALDYTSSIITPVYNENPDVFRRALLSWLRDKPTEIIAVIDQSDKRCMVEFEKFAEEYPDANLKMVITNVPGKRPALVTGMRAADGDIIFLVDSDTIWDANVLPICISPFADENVGGVTCRQSVYNPQAAAGKIFDINLDTRYFEEMRFLAVTGNAVTCLSGRTAVYRRAAVIPELDGLVNETFRGKRVISGDDKCLTRLVQAKGWIVRYQETARVYTPAFKELKAFMNQRLRWSRNSWRADLKMLASGWLWKREQFLAIHLLDRLLQPITTLIGPALLLSLLIRLEGWLAIMLVGWWFGSRAIKILPSLRRDPSYVLMLPAYLYLTYFFAVVRIFAFFTMNQQGWITRWDKNRMQGSSLWRLASSYGATAATILLIFTAVQFMHFNHAEAVDKMVKTPTEQGTTDAISNDGIQTISVDSASDQSSTQTSPVTSEADQDMLQTVNEVDSVEPILLPEPTAAVTPVQMVSTPQIAESLIFPRYATALLSRVDRNAIPTTRVSRLDAVVLEMSVGPWQRQPGMLLPLEPNAFQRHSGIEMAKQADEQVALSN